jgi:hypothetical protein
MIPYLAKMSMLIFLVATQITNSHIIGLIPHLQIRKFLWCPSPQIANPQIGKEESSGMPLVISKF